MKPKLFFDSQICIDIANRTLDERRWARTWRYVRQNFRYVVSPLTLCELLRGVACGTELYFNENREAIRVLVPSPARDRFLPFPSAFVLKTVLNCEQGAPSLPTRQFDMWVRVVLKASSKHELEAGDVRLGPSSACTYGFNSGLHVSQLLDGEREHVAELQKLREGDLLIPSRLAWAAGILARQGLTPSDESCQKVAQALDAAFHFDMSLYERARTSNYNFEKHSTDWIDEQQLYYLSDPRMRFLTADARLQRWINGSCQANRVLDLDSI
jgi:hypothetical protein